MTTEETLNITNSKNAYRSRPNSQEENGRQIRVPKYRSACNEETY